MQEEQSSVEEIVRKLERLDEAKLASSSTFQTEAFVDGKYSPSVTVSTNPETEFVTITFVAIAGKSALSVTMTKKQFLNFTKELSHFAAAFLSHTEEKKVLKG